MEAGGVKFYRTIAGLGWNSHATAEQAVHIVQEMMCHYGVVNLTCLAVPAFKTSRQLAGDVAAMLDVPLCWVNDAELADIQPLCLTYSDVARRLTGFASVAEGCALVAAGAEAQLYGPGQKHGGIVCALAGGKKA
nr:cobalamin biosynthesis protein [Acetobacter thailandicus]